jgi:transcriptional regulator with XRE-family HTH domain
MDRRELGQRLRALRAASGRTVAAVATDAGLSVPYVANLENGRGNPTMEVVSRLAHALGTRAEIELVPEGVGRADSTLPGITLPATLVRLSRGARFRFDVSLMAEALGEDPTAFAERLLDRLARLGEATGRELTADDWFRLLDAIILVTLRPHPGK